MDMGCQIKAGCQVGSGMGCNQGCGRIRRGSSTEQGWTRDVKSKQDAKLDQGRDAIKDAVGADEDCQWSRDGHEMSNKTQDAKLDQGRDEIKDAVGVDEDRQWSRDGHGMSNKKWACKDRIQPEHFRMNGSH